MVKKTYATINNFTFFWFLVPNGLYGNPYFASPCHHRTHSHAERGNVVKKPSL